MMKGAFGEMSKMGMLIGATLALAAGAVAQQSPAAPRFPDLPPGVPAGAGVTAPCLEGIEGVVLCGRFRVPEDPEAPDGRTLDLAFVVLKALNGAEHPDAVTRFHGGPGASVTGAAPNIARDMAGIRRNRDILLVDHRGTGASGTLPCSGAWPGGITSRFGTLFPLDHVAACRDRLSEVADLSMYTTEKAMDDLAALSEWLGYENLNLVGFSYGSREAQVFYARHPARTRTLVLNGVAPLEEPIYVNHAAYLQVALDDLYAECETSPRCAEAFPELREVAAEVLQRVAADPPLVRAEGATVPFREGDLAYALRGLLYGAAGRVPVLLHRAHAGDWQSLADIYLARQAWVAGRDPSPGYHFSVLCAEDIRRVSPEEARRATAGTFMGDHLIAGYRSVCELWPAAELEPGFFEPVQGAVPTLLLSGGRDPVTPAGGADRVARHLPNAVHVVVPGGGHGQGGPCVDAMVQHLIEHASRDGIDASCVVRAPRTEFELPHVPQRAGVEVDIPFVEGGGHDQQLDLFTPSSPGFPTMYAERRFKQAWFARQEVEGNAVRRREVGGAGMP